MEEQFGVNHITLSGKVGRFRAIENISIILMACLQKICRKILVAHYKTNLLPRVILIHIKNYNNAIIFSEIVFFF